MSIFATALTAMPSPSPKKKTPNGHSISRTPRVFSRVMVLDLGESGIYTALAIQRDSGSLLSQASKTMFGTSEEVSVRSYERFVNDPVTGRGVIACAD